MNKAAEVNKNKLSIKVMYYNRFLMVRYFTAMFFFANLNWLAFMIYKQSIGWLIPMSLMLLQLLPIAEQIKLYRKPTNETPRTKQYYYLQLAVNILLIVSIFTPAYSHLFFFMNQNQTGKTVTLLFLLIGCLLAISVIRRLNKIESNTDKQYHRVKQYEKILGV